MKIKYLLIPFLIASSCYANTTCATPVLSHNSNPDAEREFQNLYQCISGQAANVGQSTRAFAADGAVGITDGNFTNVTSTLILAGDWDVSGIVLANSGSAGNSGFNAAISIYSGATTTDHVIGDNQVDSYSVASKYNFIAIPSYRLSLTTSATVYLKVQIPGGSAGPAFGGRLSARRIR